MCAAETSTLGAMQVAGSRNTLAIDAEGQVLAWGWNGRGTLGHGHRCARWVTRRGPAVNARRCARAGAACGRGGKE